MKKILLFGLFMVFSVMNYAQEAIDLGLSVKWSTINVGAKNPRDCGDYYAWGEIKPYSNGKYKVPPMAKGQTYWIQWGISGTNNDVAKVLWKSWRMPSEQETRELLSCKWEFKTDDEGCYYLVTGPSGKSIILPVNRYMMGDSQCSYNECYYWTSNSFGYNDEASALLIIYKDLYNRNAVPRMNALHYYYGAFVRPVQPFWRNEGGYLKNREIEQLKVSAEYGNIDAMRKLADLYYKGEDGVEKDRGKALDIYNKLSEKGDANASKMAGKMYLNGDGTTKHSQKGLQLLYKLAIGNDVESQNIIVQYREDVLRDLVLCKQFANDYMPNSNNSNEKWNALRCEAAAVSGNLQAMREMVNRYNEGNGVVKDSSKSIFWLEKMSIVGDSEASYKLSQLYLNTQNELYDEQKGIELLTKAAFAGNEQAKKLLGTFYKYGLHVKKDKKMAKQLLGE